MAGSSGGGIFGWRIGPCLFWVSSRVFRLGVLVVIQRGLPLVGLLEGLTKRQVQLLQKQPISLHELCVL